MKAHSFKALLIGLAWGVAASAALALEVAGVKLDDSVKVEGVDLVLNGAGVRSKYFVKVYVGALYTPQKITQARSVIQVNAARRMNLHMLRGMDAQSLTDALEEGLRGNLSAEESSASKPALDELIGIMKRLDKLSTGDSVVIDMNAQSVSVSLNGRSVGKVQRTSLANALLRIWLGDNPVDSSLKSALLGG
jgi:Chalcone isomerase-like